MAKAQKGKAAARGKRSAAATGTPGSLRETLAAILAEVRRGVAALETIAARVESVRKTLWRMDAVREYDGKGEAGKGRPEAAQAAGAQAAAGRSPGRGGGVVDLRKIPMGFRPYGEGGAGGGAVVGKEGGAE